MQISKLEKTHNRKAFDCGNEPINRFIKQLASQMLKRHEVIIYVAHEGETVAGFYTLSANQIEQADDPNTLKKQSKHTPIPCVLLGRLAVDEHYQGLGLGGDLLLHALNTTKQLSQTLGIAFLVVDAKDDTAKSFYEAYGFIELQNQPLRLCYPVASIPEVGAG
ncbi:GNAT family N-acetyltransferase [Psychrobacter pygoscelis]|uniref:GNAT family N-acetyltransferase n=1 Tax=Psychrobacter pygoscelis TaxID=2488563 RepID=UPI00103A01C5|nr:GNAT family N-acetyltransferase [Psychrobacter pygoscelis]